MELLWGDTQTDEIGISWSHLQVFLSQTHTYHTHIYTQSGAAAWVIRLISTVCVCVGILSLAIISD